MDEELETFIKSRFAIPESRLVGDSAVGHDQLVTLQPAQPPSCWVPSGTGDADGADGD
jgi:hypothetical protein